MTAGARKLRLQRKLCLPRCRLEAVLVHGEAVDKCRWLGEAAKRKLRPQSVLVDFIAGLNKDTVVCREKTLLLVSSLDDRLRGGPGLQLWVPSTSTAQSVPPDSVPCVLLSLVLVVGPAPAVDAALSCDKGATLPDDAVVEAVVPSCDELASDDASLHRGSAWRRARRAARTLTPCPPSGILIQDV